MEGVEAGEEAGTEETTPTTGRATEARGTGTTMLMAVLATRSRTLAAGVEMNTKPTFELSD
jgi:hypothetical protein